MKKILSLFLIVTFIATPVMANKSMPGLKVGKKAPLFSAPDYRGGQVNLKDLLKQGPVVLVFYRGGWCPYCNIQLRELQSKYKEVQKHGASLVAVSVDRVVKANETAEREGLDFHVISDSDADIIEDYKLLFEVPDDLVMKYKNEYKIDLEADSGRYHHKIAIPATYVINQNGKIVYAFANEDYKTRAPMNDVIHALSEIKKVK